MYEELKEKKANEEHLDFNNITKDELQQLFYDESISDRLIAGLFETTPSKVKYKRSKFGINLKELIFNEAMEDVPKELVKKVNLN